MGAASPDTPLVTAASDGPCRVIAAADRAAQGRGIRVGMALAHTRAMVPGLIVVDTDPNGDAAALARIAAWCRRYAPLTAADPPDGVWVDVTGCAHLRGGEGALLADLLDHLGQDGVAARAAIADTPGAAHAVARFAPDAATVVPVGTASVVLASLPVGALRLSAETVSGLRRLGIDQIGRLAGMPRGPLVRRFGAELALRLDQAFGRVFEPLQPGVPEEAVAHRLSFLEPLLTAAAFGTAIDQLLGPVCRHLEATRQGARRLDLWLERVDGSVQAVRIGTAAPSRHAAHLGRLLKERIETIDPGLGVEAMHLAVPRAEPLAIRQAAALLAADAPADIDMAELIDRIENRLGPGHIWRALPVESDVPERSVVCVPPLAPVRPAASWPPALPRPVRLFDPPQPVEVIALLPDQPPVAFTWRRRRHRVRRADGPERIYGEWWRRAAEMAAVRDYFAVEDEEGRRFWLFRRGDGTDPATGDLRWFLHGLF
jgi:protein ImuB